MLGVIPPPAPLIISSTASIAELRSFQFALSSCLANASPSCGLRSSRGSSGSASATSAASAASSSSSSRGAGGESGDGGAAGLLLLPPRTSWVGMTWISRVLWSRISGLEARCSAYILMYMLHGAGSRGQGLIRPYRRDCFRRIQWDPVPEKQIPGCMRGRRFRDCPSDPSPNA